MAPITRPARRNGGYIIGEVETATGTIARAAGTLLSGVVGVPGMVCGIVTASGKYKPLTPGASDGSQNAAAILYADTDASAGDADAVFTVRLSEVSDKELVWPDGISAPNKAAAIAALAAKDIVVR